MILLKSCGFPLLRAVNITGNCGGRECSAVTGISVPCAIRDFNMTHFVALLSPPLSFQILF